MRKLLLALLIVPLFTEAQIITTIVGNGTPGYLGDGLPATSAEINQPGGFTVDAAGNIYIADYGNNRIRKVNTSGIITTIVGNGTAGYFGDGLQATAAQINEPLCVVTDRSGNIYFSDSRNFCVRKVNSMGIISTIAGNGTPGFGGDLGPATAALLNIPYGLVLDGLGNLYVADMSNNRVRMINTSGIISTVAGTGTPGFTGDGVPAIATEISQPNSLCLDPSGNLVITDNGNQRIRKINSAGIITTIAGIGTLGATGDGGQATAAQFTWPAGIQYDSAGNLYIADAYNYKIRKVDNSGIITTIAGTGTLGHSGDGGSATAAEFNVPSAVGFDTGGSLIIDDDVNNRLRKIENCENSVTGSPQNDTVSEGATAVYSVTTTMASPSYQWQQDAGSGFVNLANVLPYSGVNTNTLTIHDVAALFNASNYRCVIDNGSSCADTSSSAILIIGGNTGFKNIYTAREISIFPNPATTALNISARSPINQITISNLLAQTIFTQNYNADQARIDLSAFPSGLYFLKINGSEVRKFVKE